jgi:hypothetical protein
MYFILNDNFYEFMESYTSDCYPNRPKVLPVCRNDRYYRYLRNEIHEWMTYYDVKYDLSYEYKCNGDHWYLEIPDRRNAVLFKLTWL